MDAGGLDVFHQAADHHLAAVVAEGIHIHLDGIFQVLVDQHRMVGLHLHGLHHVAVEFLLIEDHLHGAAAEHVAGAHHHRVADPVGHGPGLGLAAGQAIAGLADLEAAQDRLKLLPIFSAIDRFGRGAPEPRAGGQALGAGQPAQQG